MPKGIYRRTKKMMDDFKRRIKLANTCRPQTAEHKHKLSVVQSEENSVHWKGEKATYIPKHMWMYKKFGKASLCENIECTFKNPKRYEWANLSGKYIRNRDDWAQLCPSCHRKYDNGSLKLNLIKNVR